MPHTRLGRTVEHDERSRAFGFPVATKVALKSVLWEHRSPVLDQGDVGSCTGNAMAQLCNTTAFTAARTRANAGKFLDEAHALWFYSMATRLDDVEGSYPPDDTGSSGLAVAKAAKYYGFVRSYQHSFSFGQFQQALRKQPLIVGTNWYSTMFKPSSTGLVHVRGSLEGGHEYLVLGDDVSAKRIVCLNSWSDGWGKGGRFHMSYKDFQRLLEEDGDVTVPIQ